MPLKQAHWSNRLIEEVDFGYAIEAGSLFEQVFERAIEAGSLTEQACRRGQSSNAPLKQAHLSNRLNEEVNFK